MIGTYVAALAVCGASLAIGQAAIAVCGRREWSWLSPAVGLALLCAACWATVRMPGDGIVSAAAVLAFVVASVGFLRGRVEGGGEALRAGLPVGLVALAAASLPFLAEGHFGILGTGFNPDMSQHLLATDRLADGAGSQLLSQGYPLGPHAIVVALNKGLGIGLVQGFSGLTIAVAALASLTALTAFAKLPPPPRTAGALLVGLTYMAASYFAQGAFKETMQALFILAFVLALRDSTKRSWVGQPLRLVPAALIAAGSIYVYSFPALVWLAPIATIWVVLERLSAGGAGGGGVEDDPARSAPPPPATGPAAWRAASLALIVLGVLTLPELGRMIDFQRFETFDPSGPGLGNLFGQVSPFEALGIWPSGDFRLAPGGGAVPAVGFYLGAAFALTLLASGFVRCRRRRETAIVAGLLAAAAVYAAARIAGTPYTAAKAIEVAAPLATLVILTPLRFRGTALAGPAAIVFLLAAGGSSLLALANTPVGPTSYTPALTELRPLVAADSTLILAPRELLDDQHGVPYLAWELRGGRVCIEPEGTVRRAPPPGVRFFIAQASAGGPPFRGLSLRHRAGPYLLWESGEVAGGPSPCPLIAVRQARQGPAR